MAAARMGEAERPRCVDARKPAVPREPWEPRERYDVADRGLTLPERLAPWPPGTPWAGTMPVGAATLRPLTPTL